MITVKPPGQTGLCRRESLHPIAHRGFADPKRLADADAGGGLLPFGCSEVMNPVFLPDGVKGVNDVAGRKWKIEIRVKSSSLRKLRTADGKAGWNHVLEIFLQNLTYEIDGSLLWAGIEEYGAFAGKQGVVVVGPVTVFDGIIAEAAEGRVKLAERRSVRHLRKKRRDRIVPGVERIGNHPESMRHFDRRIAHDVLRSLCLRRNPVEAGAKLHRLGIHVLDSGPVGAGLGYQRPLAKIGRRFDFKGSANRNLKLEFEGSAFKPGRVGEPGRAARRHRSLAEERGDKTFCLGSGMNTHTKDTIVINPDIQPAIVSDSILSTGCATRFFIRFPSLTFIT